MCFVIVLVFVIDIFVFVSVFVIDGCNVVCGDIVVVLLMCYGGVCLVCLCYELVGCEDVLVVVLVGGILVYCYVVVNVEFFEKGWVDGLVVVGCILDLVMLCILVFDFIGVDGVLDLLIDIVD